RCLRRRVRARPRRPPPWPPRPRSLPPRSPPGPPPGPRPRPPPGPPRPRPPRPPPPPERAPPPRPPRAAPPVDPPAAPAPVDFRESSIFSELQPAIAGAIGHRLHAAVILISRAVEDDLRDARVLSLGRNATADLERLLRLLARQQVGARHREQRASRHVVDQLRGDVLERAEHYEPRPLGRARNLLPYTQVTAVPLLLASLWNRWHDYLPPALPALRRICSPA